MQHGTHILLAHAVGLQLAFGLAGVAAHVPRPLPPAAALLLLLCIRLLQRSHPVSSSTVCI